MQKYQYWLGYLDVDNASTLTGKEAECLVTDGEKLPWWEIIRARLGFLFCLSEIEIKLKVPKVWSKEKSSENKNSHERKGLGKYSMIAGEQ